MLTEIKSEEKRRLLAEYQKSRQEYSAAIDCMVVRGISLRRPVVNLGGI
jgi:hypothetical protein